MIVKTLKVIIDGREFEAEEGMSVLCQSFRQIMNHQLSSADLRQEGTSVNQNAHRPAPLPEQSFQGLDRGTSS